MVILPQVEGGLYIIDPKLQSQALLGKLVIRGLTLAGQTWKLLLQQGLTHAFLREGKSGSPLADGSLPQPHLSSLGLLSSQAPRNLAPVVA